MGGDFLGGKGAYLTATGEGLTEEVVSTPGPPTSLDTTGGLQVGERVGERMEGRYCGGMFVRCCTVNLLVLTMACY